MTATFQVTVDDPATVASVDNTASASSAQQPAPVADSTSDPVEARIGDLVWEDLDGDGTLNGAETGISGVTVELYDPGPDGVRGGGDDTLLDTQVTAGDGSYEFTGLAAGDYVVDVVETSLPTGLALTTGNEPFAATVAAGDVVDTADFGYREQADLSLTKVVSDATANVGETVTFTVTVTNDGPAAVTGVEVTDTFPSTMTLLGNTPSQGTYTTGTGVWDVGALAVDASATLTLTARVDSETTSTNSAEVTASDLPDVDSTPGNDVAAEDDQDSASVTPPQADLVVTKTVDDGTPNVGDQVIYTVEVRNDGGDDATGVGLVDTLPAGVTYVSDTTTQGTFDDSTGTWTVGDLANGATATLTLTVTVDTIGVKVNSATASGDQFDPTSANNTDTATITPQVIDLSVTKTVDDATPNVGDTVVFTVGLANGGPDTATGVELTDVLPAGLSFVSASVTTGTYDDGTGVWTVPSLASAGTATLTITATVDSLGTKTNTAQVTAADQADSDSDPANPDPAEDDIASVDVTPQAADLSLTKVVDDSTPAFGDTVTFTVTLTNGGPDTATNIDVTDAIPAGLGVLSVTPTTGSWTAPVWTVPSLASGASTALTIVATVDATGTITNTAEVTAVDQADPNSRPDNNAPAEDDQDDAAITVPPTVDLELTKTVDDPNAGVGDTVQYIVTLTNQGPDTATNIDVTDVLPAGLTVTNVTPSGTTTWAAPLWEIASLASGASETLTIDAIVSGTGTITNTAEVTAQDQVDQDSTPNNAVPGEDDQDSATISSLAADLSLTKTVDDATPNVGDTVTFTVTLTNNGPDTATGVAVTDLLPAGLTYTGAVASQGGYDQSSGVWTVGLLLNGGSATLDISATVDTLGAKTNTAQVSAADQFDPNSTPANDAPAEDDQDSALVTPQEADLSLTKTVDDATPSVGDTITYTVTLTNNGPDTATNIDVTDVVPSQLSGVTVTPSAGTWTAPVWSVPSLASTGVATLTITGTVSGTGDLTNSAEVTAVDQADPNSTPDNDVPGEDDQDSAPVTVPATIDLSLTKTVDNATPAYQDTVTFTVTLTNDGPDAATGIEVTDVVPTGLADVVVTPTDGTWTAPVWSVPTLAAGASTTLTVAARVDSTAIQTNTAEVTAADQLDIDSTPANGDTGEDDLASAAVDAPDTVDLELGKTVDTATPDFGDLVTFTVVLTNTGPDTATGVTVTDALPTGLVYDSSTASGSGSYDPTTDVWTVADPIPSGGSATLTLTARVDAFGTLTNTAEVTTQALSLIHI